MEEWPSNWTDSRAIDFAIGMYSKEAGVDFLCDFRKGDIVFIRAIWPEWVEYANGVDNGPR